MSQNAAAFAVSNDDDMQEEKAEPKDVGGVAGKRLQMIIDRIERLNEELEATKEDVKEVYAEAKGSGFDIKAIRKLISLRKIDVEKRREAEQILELYKAAIGMM